ncbi:threonine--tRNA ligase [Patescibacteria group bacterium]|nr:threonine--tRNA ligase [Patescibacteria group bacterium]
MALKKEKSKSDPSRKDKVDHRVLGKQLDLFSFHDVAPGTVFWHGNGMIIWRELEKYFRSKLDQENYEEVSTPIMVKKDLFEKSGHWTHFKKNMFTLVVNNETYVLKPMNCPGSALIYSSRIRSYRDLPLRLSEITDRLHRNELSGTLGGLLRVRQMTQDDAHIYARPEQIESEIQGLIRLVKEFYSNFDMPLSFNFATKPKDAMGDPKLWEKAERALEAVLKKSRVKYKIQPKDGTFYGPKIDINVTDSQNREWTIATIQLDFQMPERFKLEYIDEDGSRKRPVMIHRAILGTFERFIGILIEHYQGALPFWLMPIQVAILPITDKIKTYGLSIEQKLKKEGLRVFVDARNETIGKKIREAELKKIPYILVIGDDEVKKKGVNIRKRGEKKQKFMKIDAFIKGILKERSPR